MATGLFGSKKSDAESGIRAEGDRAYERAKQTGEEANQYSQSFQLGELLKQIFMGQQGIGNLPQGYQTSEQQLQNQGALGKSLYDQTLAQAQDPDAYYQSMLQPSLMQAQETINNYYQKRGLLKSGLAIEEFGRAGVDLALKDAQARMASRQQSLNNALQVSQYGNNLGNNSLASLSNLYSTQQQSGLNSLSRQSQGAYQTANMNAQPYALQLGNAYGQQGALGQGLGTLAGAGLGALALGPMGLVPGVGPVAGAALGGSLGGGIGKSFG